MRRVLTAAELLTGMAALLAISSCSNPVRPEDLVGAYRATTLLLAVNGVTIDLLAQGATLTIELKSDGTTTGEFIAPAVPGVSDAVNASMAGTYRVLGEKVKFDQAANTIIADLYFIVDGRELRATYSFGDGVTRGLFTFVLTRQ